MELEKYRHFRGNTYEVLGRATHSETGEDLVVYRSVEVSPARWWVRPVDLFFGEVTLSDGTKIERFVKL